jgi:periplasmic copper chaperone A
MKWLVPIVMASLLFPACSQRERAPELTVENVWLRLPAAPGRPAAAYFTIRGGQEPAQLVGVATPMAHQIALHESRMDGGVMRMAMLGSVAIPAGGEVEFAPAGRHAMIYGLDGRVAPLSRLALSFRFEGGRTISVEAAVVGIGDPQPHFEHPDEMCEAGIRREAEAVIVTNCQ